MSISPHFLFCLLLVLAIPVVLFMVIGSILEKLGRDVGRRRLGGSAIPRDQLPLTSAETRALIEVARGNSHKIAADNLGLTRKTVSNQIAVVYLKKRANSITQAMARCLRDGDITLDDILQPGATGAQGEPATGVQISPHETRPGCLPETTL
jgi:DNA-binding CsgD family transcriptional regulator